LSDRTSTAEQHEFINHLINETSPYLLQHAHNPVDWYPWGEEAFAISREQNKPVLLSIGYSACHWCHVMAHESFEDEEIARLMNDNFVNIKVDREELPEVDSLYMEFAQGMMSGAAGWPPPSRATHRPAPGRSGSSASHPDCWRRRPVEAELDMTIVSLNPNDRPRWKRRVNANCSE